jgi:adenine-specific DNA-methyltransferase
MDGKSLAITAEKIAQLRELFPEVFSEDKIDFQRLQQALGEDAFVKGEHYELSWAGKSEARKEIQKQITATLTPDKSNNTNLDNAQHIFIEGENLEVLRVLQKSYFGKVKMIYIDPPYNTGNDSFVYPDDYTERQDEYKKRTGITDEKGFLNKQELWKKNSKENGQFHSVWLSMMYPRLYLSRNLLREDGVIFISIDDNEAANLKLLCDEVFGEENFVATNVWKKKQGGGNDSKYFVIEHEYILCYTKNIRSFSMELDTEHELDDNLYPHKDEFGEYGLITLDKSSIQFSQSLVYEIKDREGNGYLPRVIKNKQSCWRWSKEKVERDYNQLVFKNGNVYTKYYRPEGVKPKSLLHEARFGRTETGKEEITKLLGSGEFSYPKPLTLITHFIRIATKYSKNDIILDFFAGSGTTAQAVMELNAEDGGNRRFICVQLPEATEEKSEAYKAGYKTIADITRARIQKVIDKIAKERDSKMDFDKQALPQCNNYTLAPSNFKSWRGDVEGKEAIAQLLLDFTESQKQGSQTDNMLVELCLKSGLGLNVGYQKENGFYKTTLGVWFCFETYTDAMKNDIVAAKPQKLVCLNSCFTSDEVLSNLQLELTENGIICLII